MVIGLLIYLSGRRWLPKETGTRRAARAAASEHPPLVRGDWARIGILVLLLPLLLLSALGNQQIFISYLVWGDAHYNLVFFGHTMPVSWLASLDAGISTAMIALSVLFWRWWAARFREPDEITKLTIGAGFAALAPLAHANATIHQAATGEKIGLGWALAFHIINDIGFANVFPIGIALYSRAAPRAVAGTMIGVYYLHLFACNTIAGRLGGLLDTISSGQFWLLHAALVGAGALGLLIVRSFAGRILAPVDEDGAMAVSESAPPT
jgi:POT family proton-dependent oligopeptide transporter